MRYWANYVADAAEAAGKLSVTTLEPDTLAPSAPSNLIASNLAANSVDLTWDAADDNREVIGYRVFLDGSELIEVPSNSATLGELEAETTYSLRLTAVDAAGNESASSETLSFATLAASLPDSWQSVDVGEVDPAGGSDFDSATGLFAVEGAGADIWGIADAFHFVHRERTGDLDLRARVNGLEDTDPWAKAGLMAREGLAADAPNVFALVTPSGNLRFQARTGAGSGTTTRGSVTVEPPVWLRLVRSGGAYTPYYRTDDTGWSEFASYDANNGMTTTSRVGLAVTSHNNGQLATAEFEQVTLNGVSAGVRVGGFAAWAAAYGVPADKAADEDGDGLSAQLEYAFGGDPTVPGTIPVTIDGDTLTFRRSAEVRANADLTYTVELSSDLGITDPWTPVPSSGLIRRGVDGAKVSYAIPNSGGNANFARVAVTETNP